MFINTNKENVEYKNFENGNHYSSEKFFLFEMVFSNPQKGVPTPVGRQRSVPVRRDRAALVRPDRRTFWSPDPPDGCHIELELLHEPYTSELALASRSKYEQRKSILWY